LPILALLTLLAGITAYKFLFVQGTLENGKIIQSFRYPKWIPKIRQLLGLSDSNTFRKKPLTAQRKQILATVFNGQAIVFGVILYCLGLYLTGRGLLEISRMNINYSPFWPYLFVVTGAFGAFWGVHSVIHRRRYNPFSEKEILL